ncbi:GDSL esterase/lipase [Panicum miliaceum]|uniref:GDSL esterase/lipase n=1 Tax=Panicum miliaceum TaxID=4540 RepID=A0A3L6RFJ2_PANMI|nr:GDSL esterase/lipase [Panicum miliaceum]
MAGGHCLPLLLLAVLAAAAGGRGEERAPALFVFGDSLIDSGNNNSNLASLAKANYFPYGIDFAGGPTGRFSNGYTIVDELAELLGLPLVPPYSQASSVEQVLQGANYASAAAGILDDSGGNFAGRIPFNQQIQNFESTVAQIAAAAGASAAAERLARSIVFVGMGSNDYLNNYLAPNYDTRRRYDPRQFADLLARQFASQLTAGARKLVVAGVGSMGCIPTVLAQSVAGRCSPEVDALVLPFNANVRAMLDGLNANLPGARFTYLDNFRIFKAILANPAAFGFSVVDRGCCGIGRNGGQITCLPFMPPCADRERYVFWDAYHPTAAVNVIIAREAFHGGADVMAPINVGQLARL